MAVSGNQFTRLGARAGVGIALTITAKEQAAAILYTNLMDAIRGVTGGNTIQDGLCLWYGKTATETAQDAERRFLLAFGGTTAGTNQDLWGQYLSSLGHTGTLNDKLLKYWNSQ